MAALPGVGFANFSPAFFLFFFLLSLLLFKLFIYYFFVCHFAEALQEE